MPGTAEFELPVGDDGEDVVLLQVAGLEPDSWAALIDQHPPVAGDPPGLAWSEQTFPAALIAACCGVPLEQATALWDEGTEDVAVPLLELCLVLSSPGSVDWAIRRLAGDERLLLELDYCAPRGIAHDAFLGWSQRSQDLALAWMLQKAARCPGCGTPFGDMGDPLAAEAELKRCEVCTLKGEVERSIPEGERGHIHLFVRPVPEHERGD